ncbi:hypothetical protein LOK49_Contig4G00015 [Camellia lanceoleosa]|nr:hypothetical protein LOK49_Contig4G00015 [Camellia lanceoleosa]
MHHYSCSSYQQRMEKLPTSHQTTKAPLHCLHNNNQNQQLRPLLEHPDSRDQQDIQTISPVHQAPLHCLHRPNPADTYHSAPNLPTYQSATNLHDDRTAINSHLLKELHWSHTRSFRPDYYNQSATYHTATNLSL